MMEQRRALTIPFSVNKDNLVSWTAFAGCKLRHLDSQHKNGSMLFDHKHTALVTLEMARRKPCLVLTDVLKTEQGKTYMERIKQRHPMGNIEQMSSMRGDSCRSREEPLSCRETRSSQREVNNDKSKSLTPNNNQKPASSHSQRSRPRRRLQNVDDEEDKDESRDIEEVIIGKDNGTDCKFAEVVDCGLSVSWKPAEDTGSCDEFSPVSIKDRWTDPEKDQQHTLRRKRKDSGTQCNGPHSPKRHRESVLRLTGEDGRDGGPVPAPVCQKETGEDGDLESLDRSIVKFTVGGDDRRAVLVPIINPNMEGGDLISNSRGILSSQDNTTKISGPSEPIVLSSDDESGDISQCPSPAVHRKEDTVIQGATPKAVVKQQETSDIQKLQGFHRPNMTRQRG